ncbi:MAG TPA: protein kinase, partial [Gemmatimonadaceae bacterium]
MIDPTLPSAPTCRFCAAPVSAGTAFCTRCGARIEEPSTGDALLDEVRALFARELEIERELGHGGMAVVYSGYDPALQRRVAVKVLKPEMADDPDLTERFRREARLIASLEHPNVVSVYNVRTSGTLSAIVMQFVDGRSLDVALREYPLVALPVAGLILAQVAAALRHAHERGIVHRDVKAANVLLRHDGRAVVSDFGIARAESAERFTGTGVILGTVAYMAPEQCTMGTATPKSDQYSLGILAFELLCGRRPFRGSVAETLNAHVQSPVPSMTALRPELPEPVVSFVTRMLEKHPDARHTDLRDAEKVFRSLVADSHATSTVVAAMSQQRPRVTTGSVVQPAIVIRATTKEITTSLDQSTVSIDPPAPVRHRRDPMLIASAVAVVAVIAATWLVLRRPDPAALTLAPVAPSTASIDDQPKQSAILQGAPAVTRSSPSGPRVTSAPSVAPIGGSTATQPATDSIAKPTPVASTSDTAPRIAVEPSPATLPVPTSGDATTTVSGSLADARAVAREFVTWCNQRRWADLDALGSIDGDAVLRAEIVRLVRTAPDFAAGFERLASTPKMFGGRFITEFVIDLEWRGGKRTAL